MLTGLSNSDEENEETDPVVNSLKHQEENPLLTDLDPRNKKEKKTHKAELWFEKVQFTGL
jgi:hypothetical protein